MDTDLTADVDRLFAELEKADAPFDSLGTPALAETDAVRRLVEIGPQIVPHVIERTRKNGTAKAAAYAALVLGRIGDRRALAPLQDLRARYEAREPKTEWDHAVIGQCNVALARLGVPTPKP